MEADFLDFEINELANKFNMSADARTAIRMLVDGFTKLALKQGIDVGFRKACDEVRRNRLNLHEERRSARGNRNSAIEHDRSGK